MREIDPRSWRGAVSAVFQQFVRYHLTLAENVALGQPERRSDRASLVVAVQRAGAADIVAALPRGCETQVGPFEGGVDLSGGQWQRVAVARSFFREAQLLVLDEPTAALDPLAEPAVFERFVELTRGRTSAAGATTWPASRLLITGSVPALARPWPARPAPRAAVRDGAARWCPTRPVRGRRMGGPDDGWEVPPVLRARPAAPRRRPRGMPPRCGNPAPGPQDRWFSPRAA